MQPAETAMSSQLPAAEPRQWREGKVRPLQENPPHDPPVSRGIFSSFKEGLRRSLPRHCSPRGSSTILGAQDAFSEAWRNLSGPMWFPNQNQTPGRDRAASRRSAPSPGRRTCREDHALAHRPQMSSGRLFLDRVARQQSPSPLHRHLELTTHFSGGLAKGDISTLHKRVTFLLCVDTAPSSAVIAK